MSNYLVTWEIDGGDASSPLEAARYALAVQRDPESIATVFGVTDLDTGIETTVDLGWT